jgi:hypothetical protein
MLTEPRQHPRCIELLPTTRTEIAPFEIFLRFRGNIFQQQAKIEKLVAKGDHRDGRSTVSGRYNWLNQSLDLTYVPRLDPDEDHLETIAEITQQVGDDVSGAEFDLDGDDDAGSQMKSDYVRQPKLEHYVESQQAELCGNLLLEPQVKLTLASPLQWSRILRGIHVLLA